MTTPDLIKYIEEQTKKNISKDIIISKLVSSGWHLEDINEGFSKIMNLETKPIIPVPKTIVSDPYREPTTEVKPFKAPFSTNQNIQPQKTSEVLPVKKEEVIKEIPKEEFIPTLKPKETTQTTFNPIIPNTITPNINTQNIPMKNISMQDIPKISTPYVGQYNMPMKPIEVKTTRGVPKIAIWIFVIFVLGVLAGGGIFAYNKGLISIPGISNNTPINIPFITPSPEKIAEKALALVPDINTNNIEGTFSFRVRTEKPTNFDGQIKFVNGMIYVNSSSLVSLLDDSSLDSSSWFSFDTRNIQFREGILNNIPQSIERTMNMSILSISKNLSVVKELIKDPNFIKNTRVIGEETLNDKALEHYQFTVDENSSMDVWVDKETYIIKKFELTTTDGNAYDTKVSFNPINNYESQQTVAPNNSRLLKDLVSELSIKIELARKDMTLKDYMTTIGTEAEIYKTKYKSYGKTNTGNCVKPVVGSLFYASATNTNSKPINDIVKLILGTTNNQGACYSTAKEWAVSFPLFSNPNTYYCVDSIGVKQEITAPLTKTFCPQIEVISVSTSIPASTSVPTIQ